MIVFPSVLGEGGTEPKLGEPPQAERQRHVRPTWAHARRLCHLLLLLMLLKLRLMLLLLLLWSAQHLRRQLLRR